MEFGQKLLELRKKRGLTQEELAKDLYVSRTAVSKWESGRGYPGIDSLKEIASYFSVSIDQLLSSEKLLNIAQTENKRNIKNIYDLVFSVIDLFSVLLIILPLYPNEVGDKIYSVGLMECVQLSTLNKTVYLVFFGLIFLVGFLRFVLLKTSFEKTKRALLDVSLMLNILTVVALVSSRQVYPVILLFLALVAKGAILSRR